jgi:hypothetical protein
MLMDEKFEVGAKYRPTSIPTTLIIDKNGVIKTRHTGALTFKQLEELIK